MGNLSRNFNREEFECECGCGFSTADIELIEVLEDLRAHFSAPITINSGCRCYKHNEEVQLLYNPMYKPGSSKSKHMEGIAVDIVVTGIPADLVANYLEDKYPGRYGIGKYRGRTHIDVRIEGPARWDVR